MRCTYRSCLEEITWYRNTDKCLMDSSLAHFERLTKTLLHIAFAGLLTDQICIGKTETLNISSINCTSTHASIDEILICQKSVSAKVGKTMASQR